jgi:hypothetical protein
MYIIHVHTCIADIVDILCYVPADFSPFCCYFAL